MSSVSFPAHVVVILRRLVHVVSTLSISNQYIQHRNRTRQDVPNDVSGYSTVPSPKQDTLVALERLEWPKWPLGDGWSYKSIAESTMEAMVKIRNVTPNDALDRTSSNTVLKAAIPFPSWLPSPWLWGSLFSFQPELNFPRPDDDPPPPFPGKGPSNKRDNRSDRRNKPSKARFELPEHLKDIMPRRPDPIHELLMNPVLCDPIRTPRYPIVLCHGLYGFDSRGPTSFPSMRMHYWSNVLRVLRGRIGAEVIVTSVPGTGSIASRAMRLDEQLQERARGRGVNFLAHSMGGLDCRHLISHIRPSEYAPLSLTSICTPHRGSPFMDWCAANLGLGRLRQQEKELTAIQDAFSGAFDGKLSSQPPNTPNNKTTTGSSSSFSLSLSSLPSSFTTLLLSIVDSPAYAHLTSSYLNDVFNPATPDDPGVKYWSVASRMSAKGVNIWHPFWLPKMVLDGVEESERGKLKSQWEEQRRKEGACSPTWNEKNIPLWANEREWGNDGLVTVQSAKWGEFLGIMEGCDHWEMRGARGIEFGVDLPAIPAIGLGSTPDSYSTSHSPSPPQAQGDGWGFGDWTRFVTAWRRSDNERSKVRAEERKTRREGSLYDAPPLNDGSAASEAEAVERKGAKNERMADRDDVVRSSTESLSVVFDWLIDRVPDPRQILRSSSASAKEKEVVKDVLKTSDKVSQAVDLKELSNQAVMAAGVGPSTTASSSSSEGSPSSNERSEIKERMEVEGKNRESNELSSKKDLEKFYVALARKMWDAGL